VFFLASNDVRYLHPTSDPFYLANKSSQGETISLGGGRPDIQYWDSFKPVTGIGCTDQYQVCNKTFKRGQFTSQNEKDFCTPLGPVSSILDEGRKLGLNPYQNATLRIIAHHLHESGIYNSASSLGAAALRAGRTSYMIQDSYVQTAVIDELWWHNEVQWWFNASLASLQLNLVKTVAEQPLKLSKDTEEGMMKLTDKYEKEICKRQLISNMDGFQNFSVAGVSMVILFSVQLIMLGLHIHVIGGAIQRILKKNEYARASWSSDGYLQLQRQAYEGAGYEGWDNCGEDDDIPVTRQTRIGGLDMSELDHPRLVRAPNSFDSEYGSKDGKSLHNEEQRKKSKPPRISSLSLLFSYTGYFNRPLPPLPS
jgi:hypothetical protein